MRDAARNLWLTTLWTATSKHFLPTPSQLSPLGPSVALSYAFSKPHKWNLSNYASSKTSGVTPSYSSHTLTHQNIRFWPRGVKFGFEVGCKLYFILSCPEFRRLWNANRDCSSKEHGNKAIPDSLPPINHNWLLRLGKWKSLWISRKWKKRECNCQLFG